MSNDQFDELFKFSRENRDFMIEQCRKNSEAIKERRVGVPRKIQERRKQFVKVPWTWIERLDGASGQTYRVALYLLHLNWKKGKAPIKLANEMLKEDGVSRYSKWKALGDLERRGLITVERRRRRSPVVRVVI